MKWNQIDIIANNVGSIATVKVASQRLIKLVIRRTKKSKTALLKRLKKHVNSINLGSSFPKSLVLNEIISLIFI